ncbi:ankyrin repeat domain-containing protein [Paramyrothecium foliicola]|nr:ankyrin repeat domain-containing protein [Paramyrothecium foliicola]
MSTSMSNETHKRSHSAAFGPPIFVPNHGPGHQNVAAGSGPQHNYNADRTQINNNTFYGSGPWQDHQQDEAAQLRQQKEAYLRSLVFPNMKARFHDIQEAAPDTCDWLFDTDIFGQWKALTNIQEHNGVLWIKGKPGAGKSTLMKHSLIRFENDIFPDHHVAAYFFNARGNKLEKSPSGMLRSITYQLLDADDNICDQFSKFFPEKTIMNEEHWEWRPGELEAFLRSIVQTWQAKPLLLLIDALDECNDSDVRQVVNFLESISKKATRCQRSLKICLSSRHYPSINMEKRLELIVDNIQGHETDIRKYLHENLRVHDQEIEDEICYKASGVFMWVVLVTIRLNKAYDDGQVEDMKSTLAETSSDLDELFDAILMRETTNQRETIHMFQWILFGKEALTPEELFAIVVGPPRYPRQIIERRITSLSRGLLETRRGNTDMGAVAMDTVQFIHQTVPDFLSRHGRLQKLDPTLGEETVMASHARLWNSCLEHIQKLNATFINKEQFNVLLDENPFLTYALGTIFHHAEMFISFSNVSTCGQIRSETKSSSMMAIFSWLSAQNGLQYRRFRCFETGIYAPQHDGTGPGLLYVLIHADCRRLIQIVLEEADINAQGGFYGNALQIAAAKSSPDIVQLLIDHGADVNAQGGFYGNALQAAVCERSTDIIQLLINYGADVNAQGGYFGNALQAAAMNGSKDTVQLLIDCGADINAQGGYCGNALQAAAISGSKDTIQLLIDCGAEINAQGGFYGNALQAAVYDRSTDIIQLLINYGADVNAQGGKYRNALQAARVRRSEHINQLLIDSGADINTQKD